MYLGYGISTVSRSAAAGELSCLAFDKRAGISESDLADLFGLPNSNSSTVAQPLPQMPSLIESEGNSQNQNQSNSFCIEGFNDFSI